MTYSSLMTKTARVGDTKTCTHCGEFKPLDEYDRNKGNRDGRASWCRACTRALNAGWQRTPEAKAKRARDHLRRAYGLTSEEHASLKSQGCAACGVMGRKLVVDHNHTTGQRRGLLCYPCNNALGQLGEDPRRFEALLKYLLAQNEALLSSSV